MSDDEANPDDILKAGMAIKINRLLDNHLHEATAMKRLQVDSKLDELMEFRDQYKADAAAALEFRERYMAQHAADTAAHQALMSSVVEAITRLVTVTENPPKIPPTRVTLDQQPVTVNVPVQDVKPHVNFSPVVTIPESQVVIDRPQAPNRAIIKHSDGTRSEIIFEQQQQ